MTLVDCRATCTEYLPTCLLPNLATLASESRRQGLLAGWMNPTGEGKGAHHPARISTCRRSCGS